MSTSPTEHRHPNLMKQLLSTIADGYDSIRPGAGDCVREMADEKYPDDGRVTHGDVLRHLANLCDRHKRYLLPEPTSSTCADCRAEQMEKRRINDPD